ncbi:MAG: PEP-CTERM sorting domain-containing protein [Pseudomonadota bacterium]
MRSLIATLAAIALLPSSAHAAVQWSVDTFTCTGTLTANWSDTLGIGCGGDLTLDGGTITSDSRISFSSVGKLFLDNLAITAPELWLSGETIFVGSVVIQADSISVTSGGSLPIGDGGRLVLPPGGAISVGGGVDLNPVVAVPEPSVYLSLMSGLLLLALRVRGSRNT